jgi:hypothetical protein
VRELAAHRRATDLREEAAKLQERIGHSELLKRLGSERSMAVSGMPKRSVSKLKRRSTYRKSAVVLARWRYLGSGYQSEGEAWLARSAAADAREQRRVARLELAMA